MFGGVTYLVAYDSRMLYCISGNGYVEIEDKMFEMHSDVLLIFKYGLQYKYHHNERKDMECISVNFDYDFRFAEKYSTRIPPDTPSKFDSKLILNSPGIADIIYISDASSLKSDLLRLYKAYSDTDKICKEEIGARMKLIITLAYDLFKSENNDKSSSSNLIYEICKYIDDNAEWISNGNDISEKFSYHSYYINRLIKKNCGITLHSYILKAKINKSIEYLTTTNMPISEIAFKCGFFDTSHYSRNFKKITGYSPSKYRYI